MDARELRSVFSSNIKKYRRLKNLTQMALAEKADISVSYLCALEAGDKWGTPETIVKLTTSLNISPHQLFLPEVPLDIELYRTELNLLSEQLKKDIDRRIAEFLQVRGILKS